MLPTEGTGAKRTPPAFAVLIPPLVFRLSLDSQGVSLKARSSSHSLKSKRAWVTSPRALSA